MSVEQQLARILTSREFRDSERMQRFLRFVVEKTLSGEASSLKEYLIGVEVFDRREGYDPRVDPIVRVEARRLRSKLKAYYENAGGESCVVVDLPTGSYVPVFRGEVETTHEQTPSSPAPSVSCDRTLAVLPFTNLSPGSEGQYFSDGLTEELTHLLTKVPGLQVVSWSSAAQLKHSAPDPRQVSEQLAADVFVRGSVRSVAGRVRVMAQLLEAPRGVVLWSESWDRQIEDIFSIQDEIAACIAHALQLRLILTPRSGHSPEAYDLYLKGRYYWNTRSIEGMHQSVGCFREAIARDPGYALAWAGLADSWAMLVDYGVIPTDCQQQAEEAALRAIELDPALAEPHCTLAMIRMNQWKWAEVESLFQRALALNPNYATAHHWLGIDFLAIHGRFPEALQELETAMRLDPLSNITMEGRAMLFMMWGRFRDGLAAYEAIDRRTAGSAKTAAGMGRLYIQMGDYERACQLLETARLKEPGAPSVLGALAMAHARAGRKDVARRLLATVTQIAEERTVSPVVFAMIHIGLDEPARAIDYLEKATEARAPSVTRLGVHPAYDPLRNEPRFRALIEKIGFVEGQQRALAYRKAAQ